MGLNYFIQKQQKKSINKQGDGHICRMM